MLKAMGARPLAIASKPSARVGLRPALEASPSRRGMTCHFLAKALQKAWDFTGTTEAPVACAC